MQQGCLFWSMDLIRISLNMPIGQIAGATVVSTSASSCMMHECDKFPHSLTPVTDRILLFQADLSKGSIG